MRNITCFSLTLLVDYVLQMDLGHCGSPAKAELAVALEHSDWQGGASSQNMALRRFQEKI